jgi:hypothetical protein
MKVYGFYHILGNRRGREIVPLQMNRLHDSGLLDQTETFFVGSVGEPVDVYCPAAVRFHSNETGRYEMWTLQRLWLTTSIRRARPGNHATNVGGCTWKRP